MTKKNSNNSNNSFKNFQEFLKKCKNSSLQEEKDEINEYLDLTYGSSIFHQEIETYLARNNLINEWLIIGKLLVKKTFVESPNFNLLNNNNLFNISTEENISIFKNFFKYSDKNIKLENSNKKDSKNLLIIERIKDTIIEELSQDTIDLINNFDKKDFDLSINLIKKLKLLTKKSDKKNITTTKAYQLLGISNEHYKKHLKEKI